MGRFRRALTLAIFCATALVAGRSSAVIIKSDPFGNGTSAAFFGADPNDGYSLWVVWYDSLSSPANCLWQFVGDGPNLTDALEIFGSGGGDGITALDWTATNMCGGFTLTTPNYNGNPLYLFGDDGDDVTYKSVGPGSTVGGNGNDILQSARADNAIYGDAGVDLIFSYASSGSGGHIEGGVGNDCICVSSGQTPSSVSCGDGTDQWAGSGTRPSDCESTSPLLPCWQACWEWTGS